MKDNSPLKRLKEWLLFSTIAFLVYNLLWILFDLKGMALYFMDNPKVILIDFVYCALFSGSSMLISQLILRLKRWDAVSYSTFLQLGLVNFGANILLALGYEYVHNLIYPAYSSFELINSVYTFCIIATLLSLVHLTIHFSRMVVRQKEEAVVFKKQLLKNQLDPHFIFNSLSTLAGLTRIDPEAAENFTVRLARVYRHIVSNIDHDVVPVSEGVDFARDYVYLLDNRFPGMIQLIVEANQFGRHEQILAMSLQLLIENAVKHNRPSASEKLTITIGREGDELVVRNNLIASVHSADSTIPSFGIGLENLVERSRLECGREPVIRMTETVFEVRLPIIGEGK